MKLAELLLLEVYAMTEYGDRCCTSVPITGIHFSAYFCERHEAWHSNAYVNRDVGQEPKMLFEASQTWGPFDSFDDVSIWMEVIMERLGHLEAMPWVARKPLGPADL